MLCTQVLNGLAAASASSPSTPERNSTSSPSASIPRETPKLAAAEEGALRAPLRPPGAGRLALPDRRAAVDRRPDRGRRLPLPVRPGDAASSPTRARSSCSRPTGKLSRYFYGIEYPPRDLRLALIEASAGPDRHARRPGAALLLPLRPDDRQVRRRRDEHRAARGRRSTVIVLGAFLIGSCRARRERRGQAAGPTAPGLKWNRPFRSSPSRRPRSRAGRRALLSSSSRSAPSSHPHRDPRHLLRGPVPPPLRRRAAAADPRLDRAGADLDVIPLVIPGHVLLGRERSSSPCSRPPADAMEIYVGRQAVDVEDPAPRRPARDQRAARAGRAARCG